MMALRPPRCGPSAEGHVLCSACCDGCDAVMSDGWVGGWWSIFFRNGCVRFDRTACRYAAAASFPPLPDETVEGARPINRSVEKNRGLTPHRCSFSPPLLQSLQAFLVKLVGSSTLHVHDVILRVWAVYQLFDRIQMVLCCGALRGHLLGAAEVL